MASSKAGGFSLALFSCLVLSFLLTLEMFKPADLALGMGKSFKYDEDEVEVNNVDVDKDEDKDEYLGELISVSVLVHAIIRKPHKFE